MNINRLFGKKNKRGAMGNNRTIKVRFSSMLGDTNRSMTIQELKEDYKDYIIIDTKSGECIDIEKSTNLEEIVVKKREEECC